MMIYDPEIAAVACYRYSLIEVEQEDLPHAERFDGEVADSLFGTESEEEVLRDDSEEEVPQVVDADAAGGARQLALQDPHQV